MDKRFLLSVALTFALLLSASTPLMSRVQAAPEQLMSEGVYFEIRYRYELIDEDRWGELRYIWNGTTCCEVVMVTADTIVIEYDGSWTHEWWKDGVFGGRKTHHYSGKTTTDVNTRKVHEQSCELVGMGPDRYTYLWIPAGVSIGDHVTIECWDYEVVGSTEVEVGGLLFDAWVLRREEADSIPGEYDHTLIWEYYYEKTTGIYLGEYLSSSRIDYVEHWRLAEEDYVRMGDNNIPFDPDGDGLTSWEELDLGTDHRNPDSDGDGLTDGDEVKTHGTDPLKQDTDGDLWSDGLEVSLAMLLIFDALVSWLPNGVFVAVLIVVIVVVAATLLRREKPPTPTKPINEKELRGLIERLDERFIEGEIGEDIYQELKREYEKRLKRIKNQGF